MNNKDNKWFILVCVVLAIILALGVGSILFSLILALIFYRNF